MRHGILQTIAERLVEVGMATPRDNFPYAGVGRGRDSRTTCTATVRPAIAAASRAVPGLPLLAAALLRRPHTAAASVSPLAGVWGRLVYVTFLLHPAGKST